MQKRPNNYASNMLLAVVIVGCISSGKAVGDNWRAGKGAWLDLPCAMFWPICISWIEVGRYFDLRREQTSK